MVKTLGDLWKRRRAKVGVRRASFVHNLGGITQAYSPEGPVLFTAPVCGRHSACAGDSDHPAADGVNTRSEGDQRAKPRCRANWSGDAGQMKVAR